MINPGKQQKNEKKHMINQGKHTKMKKTHDQSRKTPQKN